MPAAFPCFVIPRPLSDPAQPAIRESGRLYNTFSSVHQRQDQHRPARVRTGGVIRPNCAGFAVLAPKPLALG